MALCHTAILAVLHAIISIGIDMVKEFVSELGFDPRTTSIASISSELSIGDKLCEFRDSMTNLVRSRIGLKRPPCSWGRGSYKKSIHLKITSRLNKPTRTLKDSEHNCRNQRNEEQTAGKYVRGLYGVSWGAAAICKLYPETISGQTMFQNPKVMILIFFAKVSHCNITYYST